jgi:hypothetical protein
MSAVAPTSGSLALAGELWLRETQEPAPLSNWRVHAEPLFGSGSGGTGGAAGAGGSEAGAGGFIGAAGTGGAGAGGAAAGGAAAGGQPSASGGASGAADFEVASGCACRLPGWRPSSPAPAWLLLVVVVAMRRRLRRERCCSAG